MRRRLVLVLLLAVSVAAPTPPAVAAASGRSRATTVSPGSAYAHVARTDQPPAGDALLVVHGTQGHPERPPWPGRRVLRYVQASGKADIVLHNADEARQWGQETAANGWDGAYLDVMDWQDANDRAIAQGLREGLGSRMLVTNGYPFGRMQQWTRYPSLVAQALSVADGFQWECAHLGDAAKVLPANRGRPVLWLVCGAEDDSAYAAEFQRWADPAWHYYGRRITKFGGRQQQSHAPKPAPRSKKSHAPKPANAPKKKPHAPKRATGHPRR